MSNELSNNDNFSLTVEFNETNVGVENLNFYERIIAIILYSFISLLAVGGNGIVLFLIVRFQRLRTPTNFLIANLALTDLCQASLCIPFSYWPFLIIEYWPFGFIPCKLIYFCQAVTVMCSVYTLVGISLDRFIAIMFPLKTKLKLTKNTALLSILAIWIGSVIIASPLLVVLTLTDTGSGPQCNEIWENPEQEPVYNVALMFLQYFIPLFVLVLTYTGIGFRLWYSRIPGEGNTEINKVRHDSVRKMIPTMLIVTSIFAICWLPQNLLLILASLYTHIANYRHVRRIWWGCHVLAMSHTVFNPIIYVIRNKKFRLGFYFVLRCFPCFQYDGSLHVNNKPSGMSLMSFSKKSSPTTTALLRQNRLNKQKPKTRKYTSMMDNGTVHMKTSCMD